MKTSLALLAFFFCTLLSVSAQQFNRIFLLDGFTQAQIRFRNHSVTNVSLNYDASNKTMLFLQGEEIMEVTNTTLIDTITVGDRQFVPATKGFYEVVYMKNGVAYIDWLLKDVNIGSKGALGAVTQGSIHNLQMNDLGLNGAEMYTPYGPQKIGSTDVYRRKNDNTYYIKVDEKMTKVKTVKHLEKIYPAHKDTIKAYAKEKKINMKDAQSALELLDYCLELAGKRE